MYFVWKVPLYVFIFHIFLITLTAGILHYPGTKNSPSTRCFKNILKEALWLSDWVYIQTMNTLVVSPWGFHHYESVQISSFPLYGRKIWDKWCHVASTTSVRVGMLVMSFWNVGPLCSIIAPLSFFFFLFSYEETWYKVV